VAALCQCILYSTQNINLDNANWGKHKELKALMHGFPGLPAMVDK
jgi:hypothetical protein